MSSGRDLSPDAGNSSDRRSSDPYYTNEDIEILHEIIVRAQELLPTLPERERLPTNALFGAYYETLPRLGLKADHDNRYARILFKVGGIGGAATLYERFEAILSRMGIEIEFDREEGGQYSQLEGSIPALENPAEEGEYPPRERRRRNSENTYRDIDQRTPRRTERRRRNSLSVLVEPSTTPHPSRLQHFARQNEILQRRHQDQAVIDNEEDYNLPQHNVRAWLASRPGEPQHGRGRSTSAHERMPIRRGSHSYVPDGQASTGNRSIPSEDFQAPSEFTAVTSAQDDQPQQHSSDQTLIELMNIKALIFRQQRVRTLSTRIASLWRDSALGIRVNKQNLEAVAQKHYRRGALRMAITSWHKQIIEIRSQPAEVVKTVQFYAKLEGLTGQVRDSILLAKAFSHWAVVASDGVERTAVAREHMIRWRTFNNWKELTIIKELVFRRQVTRKFFGLWRNRHKENSIYDGTALLKYEENLVERIYRQWLWKSRDIKATSWWAEGVKWRLLQSWRRAIQNVHEKDYTAYTQWGSKLMSGRWKAWKSRLRELNQQGQQAVTFNRVHSCSMALRKWRRETRTLPPRLTLQADLDTRLLRQTFVAWLNRSRQEQFAASVDRSKILREALTNWQHKLRLKMICQLAADRIRKHILSKWALAERAALADRIYDWWLKKKYMHKWIEKWRTAREMRRTQEELAKASAARKTQGLVLREWIARGRTLQECESTAMDFYGPKILNATIQEWTGRLKHVQKLYQWSRDAEFYFLASKVLKRWKASTESIKREKRTSAYVQVRRRGKLNLARGILLNWHQWGLEIARMNAQAVELQQNKNVIIGMNIFDKWRARAEEADEMESLCQGTILSKHLVRWRERSIAFRNLELEAIISFQERQLSSAVKKWSLQTLRQKSKAQTASDVREKNIKRTFRKIFMYWHQRTAQIRPFTKAEDPPEQLESTPRVEAWSDFGDEGGVDDGASSTFLPGYLNTPSKRSERVTAAAARFASTTPKAPLSTSFERQLRARYSGSNLSTGTRKGPGRSRLGMGEGFEDIQGKSKDDENGMI
jgi:protein SFI1